VGMLRIKMTEAQASAVECRDWSEEPKMTAAWKGDWLEFSEQDRDALASEVNDASNTEDECAIEWKRQGADDMARLCRGASLALSNLYRKILAAGA